MNLDGTWWTLLPALALTWLATYLAHSTLLLGGAWLAGRRLEHRDPALAEVLWRLALVGGVVTATLQVGVATLPGFAGAPLAAMSASSATSATSERTATAAGPARGERASGAAVTSFAASSAADERARESTATLARRAKTGPIAVLLARHAGWILGLWLVGIAVSLALLAGAAQGLRRRLRGRQRLDQGALRRELDRLLALAAPAATVSLSEAPRLEVPLALGLARREICLPPRAVAALEPRAQSGLLAHELAHLERHDPTWLLALRLLEAVLFFQPLNRLARRRLVTAAELLCDERAVAWTGDRLGLARCLTDVAAWVAARGAVPMLVPAMASRPSTLRARVQRLLLAPRGERPRAQRAALVGASLAALVLLAGFGPSPSPASVVLASAVAPPTEARTGATVTLPARASESAEPGEPASEATPALIPEAAGEPAPAIDNDLLPAPAGGGDAESEREDPLGDGIDRTSNAPAALDRAMRRLEREMDRLRARAEADAQRGRADMAVREHEMHRLAEDARRAAREAAPDAAELRRIAARARREALAARPDAAELRRVVEEARRAAREAMPDAAEMRRIADEARRAAREARPDAAERRRVAEAARRQAYDSRARALDLQRDLEREIRRTIQQNIQHQIERQVCDVRLAAGALAEIDRRLRASGLDEPLRRQILRAMREHGRRDDCGELAK